MSVDFQQWRDATLQRVRRVISLLRSTQGSDPSYHFSVITHGLIGLELEELQRLVDAPPAYLEADAMLGFLRLASLCKELPIVRDEAARSFSFDYPKLVSLLNDLASPMGIDRIERIVNLLDDAESPPPDAPAEPPDPVTLDQAAAAPSENGTAATLPEANGRAPEAIAKLPELVTLDQAAALVNRSARTLERYKKRGLPRPFVLGGGGKPHEYPLEEMKEWLQRTFNRPMRRILEADLPRYTDLPVQDRLFVEDIDSFQKVRDVNPAMVAGFLRNGLLDRTEDQVQLALEQILAVTFHRKDWGGETNDLYTANVMINGTRRATAFLLKGPGIRKKEMTIAKCGKNGDQIVRLFTAPADLFVVQYVGPIADMVVRDTQGKVSELRSKGREVHFLIMDGQDTARLLYAYGKL